MKTTETDFAAQREDLAARRSAAEAEIVKASDSLAAAVLDAPRDEAGKLQDIIEAAEREIAAVDAAGHELDRREAAESAVAAEAWRAKRAKDLARAEEVVRDAAGALIVAVDEIAATFAELDDAYTKARGIAADLGLEPSGPYRMQGPRDHLAALLAARLGIETRRVSAREQDSIEAMLRAGCAFKARPKRHLMPSGVSG